METGHWLSPRKRNWKPGSLRGGVAGGRKGSQGVEGMKDLDPWSWKGNRVVGGSNKGVSGGLRASLCTLAADLCSLPSSPLTVPMETF